MKIAVVLLFLLVLFLLHRFQKMNTHLSALQKRNNNKKRTIILKMKKSIYNVKDKDDNVVDVDDDDNVVKRLISRNTRPGTYNPAKFIL